MMTMRFLTSTLLFTFIIITAAARGAPNATEPEQGIRDRTPTVHALINARIVTAPGKVIDKGVLVMRDGVIVAVGSAEKPTPDARVWDLAGKTVYAGLIEPYSDSGLSADSGAGGARYWNRRVTPQFAVHEHYKPDSGVNKKLRAAGFVARLVAPSSGIIKGTSAVVTTGDADGREAIIEDIAALHVRLTTRGDRSNRDEYPQSPMGAVALARQAMYDADWHVKAWQAYRKDKSLPRPENNDALDALARYRQQKLLMVIDAPNELYALRADRFGREFDLNVVVRGSGDEYRRLDAIKATGRPLIVPVDFAKAPNVATPESAMSVSLEELLHWDLSPQNPARLAKAGVSIALTAAGLEQPGEFLGRVRQAVQRGMKPDAALAAMTTAPAKLLGLDRKLGTIEPGKAASFIVTDGDLFDKKTKVLETWVDGKRYETTSQPVVDVRGTWKVTLQPPNGAPKSVTVKITGTSAKPRGVIVGEGKAGDDKSGADKGKANAVHPPPSSPSREGGKTDADPNGDVKLDHLNLVESQLTFAIDGKAVGQDGTVRVSVTVTLAAEGGRWVGVSAWSNGRTSWCTGKRIAAFDAVAKAAADADKAGKDKPKLPEDRRALYEPMYPLGAFGRTAAPPLQTVLIKNATVWTAGPRGVLKNTSVLIRNGMIIAIGPSADAGAGDDAVVVDATGKHLTPGLIDCHSHIATDGGINEPGQAVTAEVRIGDFINPNDINIYRQLAGGVTTSHILHGSANPIGGQCQPIKLRWGALPEQMKFTDAPPTIKFALGENVKQSNWGEKYTNRYPQTRMGVEQIIRDTFQAARDYQRAWAKWRKTKTGIPPRRDLELDAIVEILEGKRIIHCHSYRQDEILALLRTCEQFGIRLGTLQHVLEGYKVADAIKRHGAMASTFSDWWAYKFEVYDAIPYNGALMWKQGVVVSFNSDSAELARRLNTEAAKAVKYGGVPAHEALKFVTINPAKQLHVADRTGSIEVSKSADLALWSAPPLSTYAVCEMTWVNGRKYFDRAEDAKQREKVAQMRAALIQRILDSGEPMRPPDAEPGQRQSIWTNLDIFCECRQHAMGGQR